LVTRIVVVDGYTLNPGDNSWQPLQDLGDVEVYDRTAPDELVVRAREADIIVTNKAPLNGEAIEQLPNLKLIAVTATGYNIVDVAAARRHGIAVTNVPEYGTNTVAQFTWALILELCHQVGRHGQSVSAGDWTRGKDFCYWLTPQIELAGKRLGLVGYGRIARRVGEIGKAFGMSVFASGRPGSSAPPHSDVEWRQLDELFAECDVISLHCPLTPETERMVNRDLLSRMRSGAFLVNTSRGNLINEQDLKQALKSGRLAGAAVDVVSSEPIQANNPLLSAPDCLITPHMAWTSLEARRRIMHATADNITAFLSGTLQHDVTVAVRSRES
jgi:glycerate dehydrogenase